MATNSGKEGLTDKQKDFLEHLFSEECLGNVRAAMKAAGYSKYTSQKEVLTPAVASKVSELAKNYIAANSLKAAVATVDVLDSPTTPGNRERLKAIEILLDRAGVIKKESVTVETDKPLLTIMMPPMRELEG